MTETAHDKGAIFVDPPWQMVGFVRLGDNATQNFQARELCRAKLPNGTLVGMVKLRLCGSHANRLNVSGQVGLVSVEMHGHRLTPGFMQQQLEKIPMSPTKPKPSYASPRKSAKGNGDVLKLLHTKMNPQVPRLLMTYSVSSNIFEAHPLPLKPPSKEKGDVLKLLHSKHSRLNKRSERKKKEEEEYAQRELERRKREEAAALREQAVAAQHAEEEAARRKKEEEDECRRQKQKQVQRRIRAMVTAAKALKQKREIVAGLWKKCAAKAGEERKKDAAANEAQQILHFTQKYVADLISYTALRPAVIKAGQLKRRKRLGVSAPAVKVKEACFDALAPPAYPKTTAERERIEASIQHFFPFKDMVHDAEQCDVLLDAFEIKKFDAGATLFEEGAEGDDFFVCLEGEVACFVESLGIVRTCHGGREGSEDKHYFGELALLHGGPRPASAVATTAVKVATLRSTTFASIATTAAMVEDADLQAEALAPVPAPLPKSKRAGFSAPVDNVTAAPEAGTSDAKTGPAVTESGTADDDTGKKAQKRIAIKKKLAARKAKAQL